MSDQPVVLDPELDDNIQRILKACGIHAASIAVCSLGERSDLEQRTFQLPQLPMPTESTELKEAKYSTSEVADKIFHIASITKILVAVALVIAVEVRANEQVENNPYAAFKDAGKHSLATLYNRHSSHKMPPLPGNPGIYQLLVHSKGVPSSNHRLLAPDGSPLMTKANIVLDIPSLTRVGAEQTEDEEKWTEYSNINYSLITILIEALWGGSLDDFMRKTLFDLLGMSSSFIGSPPEMAPQPNGYVVDSNGSLHCIESPKYLSTGVEAGAMGGYSSAKDLGTFFNFLLRTVNGEEVYKGFGEEFAKVLWHMENAHTDKISYTPFGLYTKLHSSMIGVLSTNRLLFPEGSFSTYRTVPKSDKETISVCYMAGSAISCGCATAFLPGENFAIAVLTDTSGPVDAADHILRLILRKIVGIKYPKLLAKSFWPQKDVVDRVKEAWTASSKAWKNIEEEDKRLMEMAPGGSTKIAGVFKGKGFSQELKITTDGLKIYMRVCGSPDSNLSSAKFPLIWLGTNSIKICVPPHLSIDRHGTADWSDLTFEVHWSGDNATELRRKTRVGEDCFKRSTT